MGSFQQPVVLGFPKLEVVSQSIIEIEMIYFCIKLAHILGLMATFGASVTIRLMPCEKYHLLFISSPLPAGLLCIPFSCIA